MTEPSPVGLCSAQYEPTRDLRTTHTCQLPAGHGGSHACPICGASWDRTRAEQESNT